MRHNLTWAKWEVSTWWYNSMSNKLIHCWEDGQGWLEMSWLYFEQRRRTSGSWCVVCCWIEGPGERDGSMQSHRRSDMFRETEAQREGDVTKLGERCWCCWMYRREMGKRESNVDHGKGVRRSGTGSLWRFVQAGKSYGQICFLGRVA